MLLQFHLMHVENLYGKSSIYYNYVVCLIKKCLPAYEPIDFLKALFPILFSLVTLNVMLVLVPSLCDIRRSLSRLRPSKKSTCGESNEQTAREMCLTVNICLYRLICIYLSLINSLPQLSMFDLN